MAIAVQLPDEELLGAATERVSDFHRRQLHARGVKHRIARRGHDHGSGLGTIRWVMERTFAWLHRHRRLVTCYERRQDLHEALLGLGCCLICRKQLNSF